MDELELPNPLSSTRRMTVFDPKQTRGSEFHARRSRRLRARAKRLFPIDCRTDDGLELGA